MTITDGPQVIQIAKYGPIFELKPPHTAESVKADAARGRKRRGLCRIKHRYQIIGKPYMPKDDVVTMALSMVGSSVYDRLARCSRCGSIAMKSRI